MWSIPCEFIKPCDWTLLSSYYSRTILLNFEKVHFTSILLFWHHLHSSDSVARGSINISLILIDNGTDDIPTPDAKTIILAMKYRWQTARLQWLQCVSNGVTAILHHAIDIADYYGPVGAVLHMEFGRNHIIIYWNVTLCRASNHVNLDMQYHFIENLSILNNIQYNCSAGRNNDGIAYHRYREDRLYYNGWFLNQNYSYSFGWAVQIQCNKHANAI